MRARTAQNVHQLSQLFFKVVLQGTICNNEFWRNTALQHCCNTVSMVAKLFQHCNAVLCWKSSLQIVLCNIIFNKKSSLLYVMTIKTAVTVESVQLIITEANKLAILQVWLRVWTQDNREQIQQMSGQSATSWPNTATLPHQDKDMDYKDLGTTDFPYD